MRNILKGYIYNVFFIHLIYKLNILEVLEIRVFLFIMNNWDQFQSTPKLLPPTVFEKTNINNISNNESNFNSSNNKNINKFMIGNANESESLDREENTQFTHFSSELEKLKLEIKKLHSENEILRDKNRGKMELIEIDILIII